MHLRDARVDPLGKIVALGTIKCPTEETGAFRFSGHDCINVALHDDLSGYGSLAPCTAERDPESGFLMTSPAGPGTGVPAVVGTAMLAALRQYSPTKAKVRSPEQGGQVSTFEGGYKVQPLSDWILEIDVSAEGLRFHLSAALRMLKASTFEPEADYWPAGQRIEIDFAIDWVTRAALFQVPVGPTDPSVSPVASARQTLLEAASIAQSGHLCGFSPSGGAVQLTPVGRSRSALVLTRCGRKRLANGFLVGAEPGHLTFPRISLAFLSLASIVELLGGGAMSAAFTTGALGDVENELRHDIPSQDIRKADVTASLDAAGLTIRYRLVLTTPEAGLPDTVADSFTLPWASLVLRYPGTPWLARRRRFE